MNNDAQILAAAVDQKLCLKNANLSDAYYYQSLPFCIIDAIFSIGVKYAQVGNVVRFFSKVSGWSIFRQPGSGFPEKTHQNTVSELVRLFETTHSPEVELFNNRCYLKPASERNRVLKAKAVYEFARVLKEERIETFQDLETWPNPADLVRTVESGLPLLKDSVAIPYFQMLAGNENVIKPDRMIHRFIRDALGKTVSSDVATSLVQDACEILRTNGLASLTPRLLDHEMWEYQSNVKIRRKKGNICLTDSVTATARNVCSTTSKGQ